jgi:glycosyltransferase involved in cell wall biosynthesis
MDLTIAFITARQEPHLEWLLDTLESQMQHGDWIHLVVVDALGRSRAELDPKFSDGKRPCASSTFIRPKPCAWQGAHRITRRDFFANANARNTAICYCPTDYVAFLDDRARLEPGWLDIVRAGERIRDAVLCGPYDKTEDWGISVDHRRQIRPMGLPNCGAAWAFGGNFCLPLAWLLEINGCEEGCDPTGQEDCVMGLMLHNCGRRIDFVVEMSVQQDRTGPVHPPDFPRLDKGPSPHDRSHAVIDRFGQRRRTEFTPDLIELRDALAAGNPDPFLRPHAGLRDWWDGKLVSET